MNKFDYLARTRELHDQKPIIPISNSQLFLQDAKMVSFCCHDYLGLADHSDIKKLAIKYILQQGMGTSIDCPDLVLACQLHLQEKLRALLEREAILFFPSRFEANRAALDALAHPEMTIFIDIGAHSSLRLCLKNTPAKVITYPHNRLDRLEMLLDEANSGPKLIVTESIFSQTGEETNLNALTELADRFDCMLFVDESHTFGTFGAEGMGLCGPLHEVDVISGSFSKACGAYGAFIACPKILRDHLLTSSHQLPSSIIGAIEAALELLPQMEGERKMLQQRAHWLRSHLKKGEHAVTEGYSPLISLAFSNLSEAEELRDSLKEAQILTYPIHTIEGEEKPYRLLLSITTAHMPDQMNQLIDMASKCCAMVKG